MVCYLCLFVCLLDLRRVALQRFRFWYFVFIGFVCLGFGFDLCLVFLGFGCRLCLVSLVILVVVDYFGFW